MNAENGQLRICCYTAVTDAALRLRHSKSVGCTLVCTGGGEGSGDEARVLALTGGGAVTIEPDKPQARV